MKIRFNDMLVHKYIDVDVLRIEEPILLEGHEGTCTRTCAGVGVQGQVSYNEIHHPINRDQDISIFIVMIDIYIYIIYMY